MAAQLPLHLPLDPDISEGSFLQGTCNQEAWAAIHNVSKWANNILALVGPQGCGKTHLGHIFASKYSAVPLDGRDTFAPKSDWKNQAIWIDNAQSADEFTLFTLLNLAITGDIKALLLCERTTPSAWNVQIPDLQSRLRNVQISHLEEPDDDLLFNILQKLFKDRGLKVSDSLISYLLSNTDRSVSALRQLVADLDAAAVQQKVNVTRSFAAKFLQGGLF